MAKPLAIGCWQEPGTRRAEESAPCPIRFQISAAPSAPFGWLRSAYERWPDPSTAQMSAVPGRPVLPVASEGEGEPGEPLPDRLPDWEDEDYQELGAQPGRGCRGRASRRWGGRGRRSRAGLPQCPRSKSIPFQRMRSHRIPPIPTATFEPPPTVGRVLHLPLAAPAGCVDSGPSFAFYRDEPLFRWWPAAWLPGAAWLPAVLVVADVSRMPLCWRLKADPVRQLPYAMVGPIWKADPMSGALECEWILWLTWDPLFQQWRLLGP